MGALQRWTARYGPVFTLNLPAVGCFVVVSDPHTVHGLLQSDPAAAHAGEATGRVLSLLGRHSILRLDADAHLERRRLLGPVFHGERITDHREWMVAASRRDLDTWPRGRVFSALPHMQAIAFAVIAHLALGLSDWRRITELQSLIWRYSGGPSLVGTWLSPVARPAAQRVLWRAVGRRQAGVDRFLRILVDERRASSTHGEPAHDALGVLLRYQSEFGGQLSDRALCDELRALLIVGHDTTAAAMAWALERLTHTPRVMSALREAQRAGDDRYLGAVVDETLRCRPPVVDTVRQLTQRMRVNGCTLEAGTLVMAAPVLVHCSSAFYGEAGAFVPERFLSHPPDPLHWIPFGGGMRRCLGASLAKFEMTVVLSQILQSVRVSAGTSRPERARLLGTMLVPHRGARIVAASGAIVRRGGAGGLGP